jgi:hypothetical protein
MQMRLRWCGYSLLFRTDTGDHVLKLLRKQYSATAAALPC